jgi:hypothetical protein
VKRWPIILGRGGTVLLAVGLALLLVSFIPSATVNFQEPPQVISGASWQTFYVETITPQQTLDVSIATNGTLSAYLLETWPSKAYEWIGEHHPELTVFPNVTYFDQFLEANSASIAWQYKIVNQTVDHKYVPAAIVNVTLAVSNHGSDSLNVDYSYSLTKGVAPTAKVQFLSELTIPIGAALTIPWLSSLLRAKGRRKS